MAGGPSEVVSGNAVVAGVRRRRYQQRCDFVAGEKPAVKALGDGSQAELEPGASAVLQGRAGGMRQLIELTKGSATFRVEHAHGDFRVATALGSVTAVGTEFSVRIVPPQPAGDKSSPEAALKSRTATLVVAVLAGTVQVDSGGRTVLVHRGENVVFCDAHAQPRGSGFSLRRPPARRWKSFSGATIRRDWDDVKQGYNSVWSQARI